MLLLAGIVERVRAFFASPLKERPKPSLDDSSALDEHGMPRAWRRDPEDPVGVHFLQESERYWPVFERWCKERGFRAFPATAETVAEFLEHAPVRGRLLYEVWQAIDARHEAYYWHSDANPVFTLEQRRGVYVQSDGQVQVDGSGKQD